MYPFMFVLFVVSYILLKALGGLLIVSYITYKIISSTGLSDAKRGLSDATLVDCASQTFDWASQTLAKSYGDAMEQNFFNCIHADQCTRKFANLKMMSDMWKAYRGMVQSTRTLGVLLFVAARCRTYWRMNERTVNVSIAIQAWSFLSYSAPTLIGWISSMVSSAYRLAVAAPLYLYWYVSSANETMLPHDEFEGFKAGDFGFSIPGLGVRLPKQLISKMQENNWTISDQHHDSDNTFTILGNFVPDIFHSQWISSIWGLLPTDLFSAVLIGTAWWYARPSRLRAVLHRQEVSTDNEVLLCRLVLAARGRWLNACGSEETQTWHWIPDFSTSAPRNAISKWLVQLLKLVHSRGVLRFFLPFTNEVTALDTVRALVHGRLCLVRTRFPAASEDELFEAMLTYSPESWLFSKGCALAPDVAAGIDILSDKYQGKLDFGSDQKYHDGAAAVLGETLVFSDSKHRASDIVQELVTHGEVGDHYNLWYVWLCVAVEQPHYNEKGEPRIHEETAMHKLLDEGHGGMALEDFTNAVNAKLNQHGSTHRATDAEVLALRLYTTCTFRRLNSALRAKGTGTEQGELGFKTCIQTARSCLLGMQAIPRPPAHTFRGATGYLGDEFDASQMGLDFAFFSASAHESVATTFAGGVVPTVAHSVVFKVEYLRACPGVDVSMISVFPGEKEVLFPPCTGLSLPLENVGGILPTGGTGRVHRRVFPSTPQ
jgi:hypothetical protein